MSKVDRSGWEDQWLRVDRYNDLSDGLFGQSTQMFGRSLGTGGINGGLSPIYQIGGPRSTQLALKLLF